MGLLPEGEVGGDLLVAAFREWGIDARWVVWDDPSIDWACDLIVVRSPWDYQRRAAEFLAWADRVERISPLLNGTAIFTWNIDKRYLLDLADRVPVVPTALLDDSTLVEGLRAGLTAYGAVVLKPRIGAGGVGLVVATSMTDERLEGLTAGPWVLQPLIESIRSTGETSVYVFGGRAVSQIDKLPAGDELRVQEVYGGRSRSVPLGERAVGLAEAAVRAAGRVLGAQPSYARVDMVVHDGVWTLSELELIEPGLYLDIESANARRFATVVARLVGSS